MVGAQADNRRVAVIQARLLTFELEIRHRRSFGAARRTLLHHPRDPAVGEGVALSGPGFANREGAHAPTRSRGLQVRRRSQRLDLRQSLGSRTCRDDMTCVTGYPTAVCDCREKLRMPPSAKYSLREAQ